MKLLVCTSNHPRHTALLHALTDAGHDVVAIIEPKSFSPGGDSPVLGRYWHRVQEAERAIFHGVLWSGPTLSLRPGELSTAWPVLGLLSGRRPIVFGTSYIRGAVCEAFLAAGALNLHAGIAPEYRGSACNMWAEYDGHPELIGAQVQRLSRGLDAGVVLSETIAFRPKDYFLRSMRAVQLGIQAMVALLGTPEPWPVVLTEHRPSLRYSRHADFTEAVADRLLRRTP